MAKFLGEVTQDDITSGRVSEKAYSDASTADQDRRRDWDPGDDDEDIEVETEEEDDTYNGPVPDEE